MKLKPNEGTRNARKTTRRERQLMTSELTMEELEFARKLNERFRNARKIRRGQRVCRMKELEMRRRTGANVSDEQLRSARGRMKLTEELEVGA